MADRESLKDVVDVTVTLAGEPIDDPAWRRQWTIDFLRGEGIRDGAPAGRDYPEHGKWTMSREDIARLLEVFKQSGASSEEAEHMTWFLPENFCRECLEHDGIHKGVTDGKEYWIAGTPDSVRHLLKAP